MPSIQGIKKLNPEKQMIDLKDFLDKYLII